MQDIKPIRDIYQLLVDFLPILISSGGLLLIYIQLRSIKVQNQNQIDLLKSESVRMDFDRSVIKGQKALDMADEFSHLIDTDIPYIRGLYAGNKVYLKNINAQTMSKFENFDFDEAKEIFGFNAIEDVKKLIRVDFLDNETLFDMYYFHYIKDSEKFYYYMIKKAGYDLDKVKSEKHEYELNFDDLESKVRNQVNFTIFHLLNRLEWLSMHFNIGIAEDDVVYQSLHQLFLHTIALLYYVIVEKNSAEITEKYYTNVIQLYNEWMKRVEGKRKEIQEENKKAEAARKEGVAKIVGKNTKKI